MSKVIITDDRPQKSDSRYPASNKKNPPKPKEKPVGKGYMQVTNTSTLELKQ